jgi:hypothetical protein
MDGETPSLPITGEWTVRHHPYRLQGNGRWDTIPTGYRGMDGGTPSLPVTGEWTVSYHPYRLQGNGRWDTIPTGYRGMDGGTPSLPVTGGWTVGHHPYRLQGNGRWVTIASDCHQPPSRPFRAAHLSVEIESSRPARAHGAFAESTSPYPDTAPISEPAGRTSTLSEKSRGLFAEGALLQGVLLPKPQAVLLVGTAGCFNPLGAGDQVLATPTPLIISRVP